MSEIKFYPMSDRPTPEESDTSFSKTVIVYGERVNDVGLGYFDFEMNEWLHFGESTFLLKCWCYVPYPINTKNTNWELTVPRGYQKSFYGIK